MHIIGTGTDIVEVARIARLLDQSGSRFVQRVLSAGEQQQFAGLMPDRQPGWFARRFATKEALAKALGTGIGAQACLTEIETRHDALGRPELVLHGVTEATAARLGVSRLSLSVADEQAYAVAFVILTGE
ncbi:MAG: holo-ACP synthase [Thiothrix sp.]|nr:holo-ACP synthase [Thiothrix sp.]HPQ97642.1 holo-ACP synthase [Thiolinea sp.]